MEQKTNGYWLFVRNDYVALPGEGYTRHSTGQFIDIVKGACMFKDIHAIYKWAAN